MQSQCFIILLIISVKEVEALPNPEFNTLEEARAEILRLNEELTTAQTERDNYSTQVNELTSEVEKVRELNQKYFLKLSAQYHPTPEPEDEEPDTPTCEDFAKTLTI